MAQVVKNLPEMWETWVWSLDWEDPLEKGTQYPGLENSLDRETWQTTVHGVTKSRTCLSDFQIHCVLATQLCLTLCDTMDCSSPGSSVHEDSPGKNTGVGCHALLQGIFPMQGSNPDLPHCRQILYLLSHQGSPITLWSDAIS